MPWELFNYMFRLRTDRATFEELAGTGKPWDGLPSGSTVSTTANRVNMCLPPDFPWRLHIDGRAVVKKKRESQENPKL